MVFLRLVGGEEGETLSRDVLEFLALISGLTGTTGLGGFSGFTACREERYNNEVHHIYHA